LRQRPSALTTPGIRRQCIRGRDDELETAARACRALAYKESEAAKRMENPGMRGPVENTAKRAAALAEKFERMRRRNSE